MSATAAGRIDSHQHFWRYTAAKYSWISESMGALQHDFLPDDLQRAFDGTGITGCIAVQACQTIDETEWLLELAARHGFIRGVVGWVPLIDGKVDKALARVTANPKLRGIRHILQDEPDPLYMLRDDFNRGIRALKPLSLVYDILIFERHLPQTIRFVDRHPDQVFVLDHLAKPKVRENKVSPWRENMAELARRPNVYCKISGLVTEADHQAWTEQQLVPYLDTVLEAFGPKRLMFGSDWPVCLLAATYTKWLSIVENVLSRLSESEQKQIWSATAEEAYRLQRS